MSIDHERVRQRAAAVAEWRLHGDVTFEHACEYGAAWIRYLPSGVERIYLSANFIAKLGRLPTGDEAYDHFRMGRQYQRLARDRADIERRLADDGD